MAVRKLPSGKFQADYWYRRDGRLKRRKQSFLTKTEAVNWQRRNLVERDRIKIFAEVRTINDAIESYKNSTLFLDTRESTRKRYADILTEFVKWCEASGVSHVHSFDKGDLYGKHLRSRFSPRTVILHLKVLSGLFKLEMRNGLKANPFSHVVRPKVEELPPRFFTDREIQEMFKIFTEEQRAVFGILLYTGLRTGELVHLQSKYVTAEKIIIRPTESWSPKTPRSARSIPVPEPARHYIESLLKVNGDKKYLIGGDILCNKFKFYHWHEKTIKRVPVDISGTNVHTFRKTYGSLLLQRGVPIAYISRLMGHSSISVTERIYAGLRQSNLEEAASTLNDLRL